MSILAKAERAALYVFLGWMLIGLAVTLTQTTGASISAWALPAGLHDLILLCLHYGDAVSIVLAAVNTHWLACRTWGTARARKWALSLLVLSAIIETIGTLTGWPFGPYHYTDNFGPRFANTLPVVVPLSWLVLVTNVLFLTRNFPYLHPWSEAFLAAMGVTFLDWILEPFAVHLKVYWYWDVSTIPWQNYLSWFAVTFLFVSRLAPSASLHREWDPRPALILGAMFALFIGARLVNGV